jgi:hypothetical protein
MSQQYATVVRRCRQCDTVLYGPSGIPSEVWPHWINMLQGNMAVVGDQPFFPFHECANGSLGALEAVANEYRYTAPYPDPAATITDPDVLAAMAPKPGEVTGYDIDQANAALPGGGK